LRRSIGIFWKYFIAYSATVTIVIFILALLMNVAVRRRHEEIIKDDLEKYAIFAKYSFRSAFDGRPETRHVVSLQSTVQDLGKQTGARITLIATDGTVLADSDKDPALMENHAGRPEIKKALSGEIGSSIRYSTTVEEKMNYVAVPVIEADGVKGVVRVSLSLQSIELLIGDFTRRIVYVSLAIWGISLILTFLFSSIFSASVKHLVDLTKRFASGDFTKRAMVNSRDELGELAAGLNDMRQKLQSLFSRFQKQHDELNAIINSMTEGVLVLDPRLHVTLANDSFRSMFSVEGNPVGKAYIEAVRFSGLKEMIDDLLQNGEVRGRRMEFDNRILLGNGMVLEEEGEDTGASVLVFHDMTSDAQIEKLKADLVANASHELRTPLTAIKGYLETLDDEDADTQRNFVQIIRRNVDRMSNLVSDLLLLSRLESPDPHLGFEEVDLRSIAEDVIKLVERLARGKSIELKVDIGPGITVNGDSFLLEQMLLNLLDNAVKYTEKGEVTLRADRENGRVEIQVSDTGAGIPSRHISRIFERFYRVDKARSRDLGGTGLGLSIVKHIVQLHKGDISVHSQVGTGTTFTIVLPSGL
jgi:two-component system phosphate regulon sensor histidine kinase PhoR